MKSRVKLLFNLWVALVFFLNSSEMEAHFSWRESKWVKERVWQLIMKEAIQIIQMLALPLLSSPPPRQWRVFSVPREWCQHGPLKTAAVRCEMNAPAEHNGPNLNTTRIYARSEPQQKKEGYSAPIQPCCYFISRKFASTIYAFCSFQVFMEFGTRGRTNGAASILDCIFVFTWLATERRAVCLCLTADLHGLGQPLPCQVRTQASDQGPANRRHRRSAAGWDNTGRR